MRINTTSRFKHMPQYNQLAQTFTVYYHVTYAFHSESTLYSCLNVKELIARNRCDILSLSGSNEIRTHQYDLQVQTRASIKVACSSMFQHVREYTKLIQENASV